MVTSVPAFTEEVVIVNAGDTFAPLGTVTVAGAEALGSLLVRLTTVSAGTELFIVIVFAVVDMPPRTVVGARLTEDTTKGNRVKVTVLFAPA